MPCPRRGILSCGLKTRTLTQDQQGSNRSRRSHSTVLSIFFSPAVVIPARCCRGRQHLSLLPSPSQQGEMRGSVFLLFTLSFTAAILLLQMSSLCLSVQGRRASSSSMAEWLWRIFLCSLVPVNMSDLHSSIHPFIQTRGSDSTETAGLMCKWSTVTLTFSLTSELWIP